MYYLQANQRRLLASINPLLILGFMCVFALFFSALKPWFSTWVSRWDVLLPFIVFFGQRRTVLEGLLLTLLSSHFYSMASGAPIGLFTVHYLFFFILSRLFSYVLYANRWYSILVLTGFFTFLARITITFLAASFGHGWPFTALSNLNVGYLVSNTIYGYFAYVGLVILDKITGKLPRGNIELKGNR